MRQSPASGMQRMHLVGLWGLYSEVESLKLLDTLTGMQLFVLPSASGLTFDFFHSFLQLCNSHSDLIFFSFCESNVYGSNYSEELHYYLLLHLLSTKMIMAIALWRHVGECRHVVKLIAAKFHHDEQTRVSEYVML